MFIALLIVTFLIAFLVSFIVTLLFKKPLNKILNRIINDAISQAWSRYLTFAIYVVGISNGVRVWDLEKYITATKRSPDGEIILLNMERWILELYRTIIGTLQGIAWMLLVFFIFSLVAYVIIIISERRESGIG